MTKKQIEKLIKGHVIKKTKKGYRMKPVIIFEPTEEMLKDFSLEQFFVFIEEILVECIRSHIKDTKKKYIKEYGKTKKTK